MKTRYGKYDSNMRFGWIFKLIKSRIMHMGRLCDYNIISTTSVHKRTGDISQDFLTRLTIE